MLDLEALIDLLTARYDPHDLIDLLEVDIEELVEALKEKIEDDFDRLAEIVLQDQENSEDESSEGY